VKRKPETHILRRPEPRLCCVLGCHAIATIKRLSVPSILDESLGTEIRTLYYCASHADEKEKTV
jgi:hypothetical protein